MRQYIMPSSSSRRYNRYIYYATEVGMHKVKRRDEE